jgi:ribose 5-phosphate isomerase
MNAQNWIEVIGLVLGGGGGGTAVAKLTRLAVAVEQLVKQIETLATSQAKTATTVQDHEIRLAKGGL